MVERAESHPRYKYFPETGEERFSSLMAVPLIVRGVTIGVLVVQTRERAPLRPTRRRDAPDLRAADRAGGDERAPALAGGRDRRRRSRAARPSSRSHGVRVAGGPGRRARERTVELRGIGTSRGIAIGPIYRLENPLDLAGLDYRRAPTRSARSRTCCGALQEARRELDDNRDEVGDRFGPDFSAVFHTHIQILEDKGFVAKLRERGARHRQRPRRRCATCSTAYRATFARIEDPYFRDRIVDVEDVGRRVMEQLLGERHQTVALEPGSIVVTDNILPGHFARLELDKVAAIVSEHGGPTSHGAIFARTLEIPAVTGVAGPARRPCGRARLAIVDGGEGNVFLSPDERLLAEYQRARQRYEIAVEHLDALRDRPAETRDGRRIALTANCGLVSDLRLVEQHGAEGVGLFRTEMLAFAHRGFPEEEEQEQLYERVAGLLAPRPVTIRTLDLGGDKELPDLGRRAEENPQLGCRSIRLSLLEPRRASARSCARSCARAPRATCACCCR